MVLRYLMLGPDYQENVVNQYSILNGREPMD